MNALLAGCHSTALCLTFVACTGTTPSASSPVDAPRGTLANAGGQGLVMEAASCWMGGLWSDALGETDNERNAGIERRCLTLLRDVDITRRERARAIADRVPPPSPEEAYFPLRAVEPHIVDAVAEEVQARAERAPAEAPHAKELVALLRAVAAATRETIRARRAADIVKNDEREQASASARNADKDNAAAQLGAGEALDSLIHVDAGPFTPEARAMGLLSALDRMEIARGLPKHLKILVLSTPYADIFGVTPPTVPDDASAAIRSGTWLGYITEVAAAAGHPVPVDAHDPQNREPLAWTGILAGFADRLRADSARVPRGTLLGDVERAMVTRLDNEFRDARVVYEAHAPADR